MRGVAPRELRDLLRPYAELHQGDVCQQSQSHGGCGSRAQALLAWELLIMDMEGQTDLALDHTVDQQAEHGQHREGRDPLGLLPPHGAIAAGCLLQRKPGAIVRCCS